MDQNVGDTGAHGKTFTHDVYNRPDTEAGKHRAYKGETKLDN